ncbi:transposase [Paucibacter soli]|uniref:transposase n=1 Tax=Paucibacter soli TaxID=3133433 RepID=UPI0030AFC028
MSQAACTCGHRAWDTLKIKAALPLAGLPLPPELPAQWVVDCKSVGDGQAALRYLGRYLYRGVIQESDILSCKDGQVTYRWRDAKTGKAARRTIPGADFLWLLLQHVLTRGLQRARNFGFLHHNSRRTLCLLQLTQRLPRQLAPPEPPPTRPVWRCSCGQPRVILSRRMRAECASSSSSSAAPHTVPSDKPEPGEAASH